VTYHHLAVSQDGPVVRVALNRPEVHNALNGELVRELWDVFAGQAAARARVVVLSGEGPSFCAGADLKWLREIKDWSYDRHLEDARALFDALEAINTCPAATVARVHGGAFGGGLGLLACCDVAVAAEGTRLGFTEGKLGLLPAVISPFVVPKIGHSNARALFATAERFGAERAQAIGLVHHTAPAERLDEVVNRVVRELLGCAPDTVMGVRELVSECASGPLGMREQVAALNARRRTSEHAQEGMAAFLEKRKPHWAKEAAAAEG
jgi:methylglutaconyl-CoA hydratase